MKLCIELFLVFAKIGAVTFGGGYAMLPMLQRELVEKRHWVTSDDLTDYFAIGQCTPGIIAVNTATFVGYKLKKSIGGVFATLGVVFPSVVIISIIAAFISNFSELEIVKDAFAGIRACVCVLIFTSIVKLFKSAIKDPYAFIMYIAILCAAMFTKVNIAVLVVIAATAGIVIKSIMSKEAGK